MKRWNEVLGTLIGGKDLPFEKLPLTWKLDGRPMQGIPAHWERTVKQENLDANRFRTAYTGKCACGLTITVTATEYRDYPVVEWQASFANTGEGDTPVLSDMMLGGTLAGDFRYLHWGNGDTCRDDGH